MIEMLIILSLMIAPATPAAPTDAAIHCQCYVYRCDYEVAEDGTITEVGCRWRYEECPLINCGISE